MKVDDIDTNLAVICIKVYDRSFSPFVFSDRGRSLLKAMGLLNGPVLSWTARFDSFEPFGFLIIDHPFWTQPNVYDSEMSEQLDMMSEFCYGPDAFKNSGISHSYVRVRKSIEEQRPVLTNGHFSIQDMCNDLLKEFVSKMNGVNRNEAGDGIY